MSLVSVPQQNLIPSIDEIETIRTIAKAASESKYFEKLGGASGIFCIALYAKEIGVPIMTALMGGMNNVLGKISLSPELMNTLIRRDGHKLEILESSDLICRIKGTRKDSGESYICSFSFEDAKKANLVKQGSGWEKYTSDMLFARCISRLRRRLFPDVATRSYVEGEIEDHDHEKTSKNSHTVEESHDPKEIEVEAPIKIITLEQLALLEDLIGDDKELRTRILKAYNIKTLDVMPEKFFSIVHEGIIRYFEKKNITDSVEKRQQETIERSIEDV